MQVLNLRAILRNVDRLEDGQWTRLFVEVRDDRARNAIVTISVHNEDVPPEFKEGREIVLSLRR